MEPRNCQYCPGICYPYTYSNPEAIKKNTCARCYIAMTKIIKTKNKCSNCASFHQHSSKFYIPCGTCNICHPVWDIRRCARPVKFSKLPDCIKIDNIGRISETQSVDRIKQYINAFYTKCKNCSLFHAKNETILQCPSCKNCCTSLTVHKLTCLGDPKDYPRSTYYDRDHCSSNSSNDSIIALSNISMLFILFAMSH